VNHFRITVRGFSIATLATIVTFLGANRDAAALQDTTATTAAPSGEQQTVTTQVKSGEVVYISGNDLVVKLENGQLENFILPDDFKFQVDGKDLTASELKPGMRLTQTITSTATPHVVKTVRTIHGTVWHVNAPNVVILRLPDHTNKQYQVPKGQQFSINGEMKDVFHLKKGMKVTATVITESTETVHTTAQNVTGQAPLPPPPQTPPETGVLLVEVPAAETEKQESAAMSKPTLPNSASELPLIVLLGGLSVAGWVVLRFSRSKA